MRRYKIINNTLGWIVFMVAAITYLLTIEPTASFWDCPEFIAQGDKLEIGHPPGNPIFILAARFAINFAGGDVLSVAKCVNAMSALLSAATILLLFWTITHLVKKLIVPDGKDDEISLAKYFVIMGSGIAGALAYTWSDTFWFSAVEAEVYAFSSFCTALVFWLILKWEDHADEPGSDRWLILIAYVFGVSLGVHLLNLLCIPAIALVFYYRKFKNPTAKGSILAILVSFAVIVLILYGLEPGFVEVGQYFDLFFVNTLHLPYNSGVLAYAAIFLAVTAWCLWELYKQRSVTAMKWSFLLCVLLSGIPFIGDSMAIPVVILVALAVYLFKYCKRIPVRVLANVASCILVIFIGFSCYALVIIRSSAQTPLDENSPNNMFALEKYLSRDQYGKSPLIYGRTLYSSPVYQAQSNGTTTPVTVNGKTQYSEIVKTKPGQRDEYHNDGPAIDYKYTPELNMLFPRIYDQAHESEYREWLGMEGEQVNATTVVDADGHPVQSELRTKPTMIENLRFFFDYQLNYMYWRYFMWNFAGRQNDIQGMGEITQGNWITGIPFIDKLRLGDQKLLPADLSTGNKGHNVFYCLPLLLGIIGLLWQAFTSKRGIEQFWVIFFLFFMTGIAIVMYLNQTPSQPRERDYAYAGSFYAYSIWIGLGVAGLWRGVMRLLSKKDATAVSSMQIGGEKVTDYRGGKSIAVAAVAAVIGLLVPLQMVSQTWDDHDRSGRYPAHDFGMNYLSSVDKNAILFCNGDNDTFPLWYLQEVEGYRTDVRVVNLSYLSTDWYIAQMQRASYEAKPAPMLAGPTTFAYGERQYNYVINPDTTMIVPALKSLAYLYGPDYKNNPYGVPEIKYPRMVIPVDVNAAVKQGIITPAQRDMAQEGIMVDVSGAGGLTSSQVMSLDMIASSIAQGWKRPCYFAMTIPDNLYLGLSPYMRNTGMTYEVTPLFGTSATGDIASNTDKMYNTVTTKFRWAGIDKAKPGSLYLDETIRRMVTTTRSSLAGLAIDLAYEGVAAQEAKHQGKTTFGGKPIDQYIADRYNKAMAVLALMETKLPTGAMPYSLTMGQRIGEAYWFIGEHCTDAKLSAKARAKAIKTIGDEALHYGSYCRFYQSLDPSKYSRLTRNDQYIDQRYVPTLLLTYQRFNPKGATALFSKLTAMGVNMNRTLGFAKAMTQQEQMEQQGGYDEESDATDTAGASQVSLSSALGE